MAYAIAKPCAYGRALYVTAIRCGGLRIDNARYDPDDRFDARCLARKWVNKATAERALAMLHNVGGYDDYELTTLN